VFSIEVGCHSAMMKPDEPAVLNAEGVVTAIYLLYLVGIYFFPHVAAGVSEWSVGVL